MTEDRQRENFIQQQIDLYEPFRNKYGWLEISEAVFRSALNVAYHFGAMATIRNVASPDAQPE